MKTLECRMQGPSKYSGSEYLQPRICESSVRARRQGVFSERNELLQNSVPSHLQPRALVKRGVLGCTVDIPKGWCHAKKDLQIPSDTNRSQAGLRRLKSALSCPFSFTLA